MRGRTAYILWGTGILTAVFGLSLALSWWHFGYLDLAVVLHMGLVLAPVWAASAFLLYRSEARTRPACAQGPRPAAGPIERADPQVLLVEEAPRGGGR